MTRLQEIEARLAAIAEEMKGEGADIDALSKETDALTEERKKLKEQAEKRAKILSSVAAGSGAAEPILKTEPKEGRKFGADSPEYRSAFFKNLLGEDMSAEERAAFTATTANTAAVLPTTTLDKIWDLITGRHSIMNDITVYRTGTILEVIKHTAVTAGKAKKVSENAANDDENNTFVKVTLSGNDFSKTVKISYAMSKMSVDSLETYLVNEIGAQLGEVMADDAISTISTAINAKNKKTSASTTAVTFAELATTFGLLKRTSTVKLYCSFSTLYNQLVSMTDANGRPIYQPSAQDGAMGALLGAQVRIEDGVADGTILIGDPTRVVYNMVQDVMIESDKDIANHVVMYSGYARGQGALIDDQSFASLALKSGV